MSLDEVGDDSSVDDEVGDSTFTSPWASSVSSRQLPSLSSTSISKSAAQKVVLKVLTMTDEKTRRKAMKAASEIFGVESLAAEPKEQTVTVIGSMDPVAVLKKLKKKVGKVMIVSVGPPKKEGKKKEDKQYEKEVVLKFLTMTDGKTMGKAMKAASEIAGVESVAVELKEQTLTVIGSMDPPAVLKKLKKKVGKVMIVSVGPARKERKEEEKKVGEVEIVSVGPSYEERKEEEKKVGEVEIVSVGPAYEERKEEEKKEDKKEGKKKTTEDAKRELIMYRDEVGESSTSSKRTCSVFLSFRGADVNFADRLYRALLNVGLLTFRDCCDDDEMDAESDLDARRAVHDSKVAVIILSKDFASSICCLEKVSMLMQLSRQGQVLVLPVFLKVDPSDVWRVKGTFRESFERHEKELKETFQGEELLKEQAKVAEWRDALRQVALFFGHVYKQGYWSDFIRVVVDRVWRMADLSKLGVPSNPLASSSENTYDAFLCLGVKDDIRHDFGDWLYHELLDAGLFTFRNDNNKGTEFELTIKQVISESKVAVILISRDFASSSYCLDEVVMIMKRWKRKEVEVLPVFFMVEPDDVLEVKGTFGESFKTHEEKLKSLEGEELEKMKCKLDDWRAALQQVAKVTDHREYTKGYWSQFIQGVVDDACSLANIGTLEITPYSSENAYDVFLSLSGDEARHDFSDWLYHALQDAGLRTFWTDKYKEIDSNSDIMKAISESKVAIIIFSRDFASSAFCLDEVAMFMECQKTRKGEVLPVFFKVEPSDIWEFKGAYAKAFKRYEKLKGFGGEKLPKWRAAIQKVAKATGHVYAKGRRKWLEEEELAKMMPNLATLRADLQEVAKITDPHVYKGGYLSEFIKRVVDDALRLANPMALNVPSHVVGKPNRFRKLEEWVRNRSSNHCIALLYGEHGIGKKTIAAVVTNQNYKDFDAIVFLDNVAERFKPPDGIVKLQSNLLSGLGKPKGFSLSEQEGIAQIEEHLKNKRVLIVIADLGQPQQFFKLIKDPNCLEMGSKVIVTSVDPDALGDNFCAKFPVGALKPTESFELFSWHAFGTNRPLKEYESSDQNRDKYEGSFMAALRYCRGIPSVLKAFASFSSSLSMDHWDELLPRIKEYFKLRNDLKSSFDSYLGEEDKKLFFDIACFYAGRDHDHVDMVLNNSNLYEKGGFDKLQKMHLVSVDANNKVTMDQLTVDMAREIVRQETDIVEQRSNIWSLEDGIKLLRKCNETKHTRSLILATADSASKMEIKTEAFAEMTKLKLLQLVNIRLLGDFQDFPKDLVWLSWVGMSLYQIPDNISLEDLVILDLSHSSLQEFWNGSRSLKKLKILNLSHCLILEKIPDFRGLHVPNLEKLMLDYCLRLSEIHSSIEVLASLVQLSLEGCVGLKKLPILGSNVKFLDISGCTGLQEMPNGRIESIKELCADQVTVDQLWAEPAGFSFFVVFFSLIKLSLVDCKLYDEKIIDELVDLPYMKDLDLSRNLFTALPEALGAFPSLRVLSLEECKHLEVVRKLPNGLEKLNLVNCNSLRKIDGVVRPSMNLLALGCVNLIQVGDASRSEVMQREDVEMINNLKLYSWVDFSIGYQIEMANTYTGVIEKTLLQDQPLLINYGIFSFFIRGSQIPEWYDHQTEKNFLMLLLQPEPGCKTVGINLCVAYNTRVHYSHLPIRVTLSMLSDSKKDLYWEYSPVAYATEREDAMMWFSHWKLTGTVEPGDGLMICVSSPTNAVEVTRFGICLASEDEAKQPVSRSTWYQKLDVDLSTYQTSPGHFDLVNQRHRCVIPMVL